MAAVGLEDTADNATAEEIGSRIAGRYLVEGLLGQGGMAAVYRAHDELAGRQVALKRLHRTHLQSRPLLATFFQREYHTLKQLAHPGIVEAYDFGTDERGPYYTMELLSGTDLSQLAPLPFARVCEILCDVASALALIHSRQLLHRDVSPRNVRCTPDGKPKLVDFGTLASMGVRGDMIGTPPCMAPEAVNRQALDARTDLYSLGALGYYLLTGRHAYPARSVKQLRDVWRSRPAPLTALARDVPRPLETLISSMLSLDPLARPVSAGEVIERLIGIGGLPAGDARAAARPYLSTPNLVGRSDELLRFRKQLLRAARGRGGAWLIEAPAGMGRTRLLQAVELEGRLAGATVLHASSAHAPRGHCGTIAALAEALFELQPELALAQAQTDRSILGHLSPAVHARLGQGELATAGLAQDLPGMVQSAACEWLLRVCRKRPLLIEVDDAEHADQGSLGVLTALAQRSRTSPLVLAVAIGDGKQPLVPEAIAGLRRMCNVAGIAPLTAEQCEALVRSVFGGAPNCKPIADFVYRLSDGNPRSCMELLQHLLDRGVVRYERSGFVLPESLREYDLPETLGIALDRSIAQLPPEARELCQMLSLSDVALTLPEYPIALGVEEPHQMIRAFSAVDALVDARVLVMDKDAYRFRQPGHLEAARRSIPDGARRTLHLRLARIFELRGDQQRRAEQLLNAGEELLALTTLIEHLESTNAGMGLAAAPVAALSRPRPGSSEDTGEGVRIRQRLLEVCERHNRPPRESFMIRGGLIYLANLHDMSLMRGHVERQIAQLRRETGASYWHETDPALPPLERARGCLARAQAVYDATPPEQRVLAPSDAAGALIMNVGVAQAYARQSFELQVALEAVELIGMFRELSPAHRSCHNAALHALEIVTGRAEQAAAVRARQLAYYDELMASGTAVHPIALVGCAIVIQIEGLYRAMRGGEEAFDWAQRLEDSRNWPWLGPGQPMPSQHSNHVMERRAWEIRRLAHLYNGNADGARGCLEPIEALTLQHAFSPYGGGAAFFEAQAFALCGDLMGLKQSVETIATIVERQYPGWAPFLHTARGDYHRLRGELGAAVQEYDRALAATAAGGHAAWVAASAGRIEALCELGAAEQARVFGRRCLAACEAAKLGPSAHRDLSRALALAEAAAGDAAGAAARLERCIAAEREAGLAGVMLGALYEARAWVALAADDAGQFERYARLTAVQYQPGRNPALIARYERLTEAARNRRFLLDQQLIDAVVMSDAEDDITDPGEADRAEQGGAEPEPNAASDQRALRALRLLIDTTEAKGGLLYKLRDEGVALAAALHPDAPPAGLESALAAQLEAELAAGRELSTTSFDALAERLPEAGLNGYQLCVITRMREGRALVVGIAALLAPQAADAARERTLAAVAGLLSETEDTVSVFAG